MQLNQTTKIIGGAILTVVLGAIGSGVWERLLSPAWAWLVRQALTILTLGIDSASDAIYKTVAEGHSEKFSLLTYIFVTLMMMAIPITGLVFLKIPFYAKISTREDDFDAMIAAGDHDGIKVIQDERRRLRARLRKVLVVLLWLLLMNSAIISGRAVSMSYSNGAISHFNQSLAIVSPYLSVKDEQMIKSQFAGIRNKADYVNVMQKIETSAKENGRSLEQFTVW